MGSVLASLPGRQFGILPAGGADRGAGVLCASRARVEGAAHVVGISVPCIALASRGGDPPAGLIPGGVITVLFVIGFLKGSRRRIAFGAWKKKKGG